MFGITAGGNSVACHVHNFTPYFYVEVDTRRVTLMPEDLKKIKSELNNWNKEVECVKAVEIVTKSSVMHY
jgi:DNA polymerase elongation subunit (family B)